MQQEVQDLLAEGVEKAEEAADWGSVVLVFLFPVISGAVFWRVRSMGGAPAWVFWVLGFIFAVSLIQAVYYLTAVVRKALFGKRDRNETVPGRKDGKGGRA